MYRETIPVWMDEDEKQQYFAMMVFVPAPEEGEWLALADDAYRLP